MKKLLAISLVLMLTCGCTFALHRVTTTAEVVPVQVVKLETVETKAIQDPAFWLNLIKLVPVTEVSTNKPQMLKCLEANQSLGVPSGIRLTRQHFWFYINTEKESDQ